MAFDLLIRGGKVVTPDGVKDLEIAVADGRIAELAPGIRGAALEEIDATGLHVFPGLIDPHVHFNEPGRTDWEGFVTGSGALAAGGGTCFFDMPLNSSPPTLDGPSFDAKLRAALASSRTDFALWGGLTPDNLDKLEELAARGVIGFKAFMCDSGIDEFRWADIDTLRRGMTIAARLGLPVAVHAEDHEITARLTAEARAAHRTSYADYVRTRPPEAEVAAIRIAHEIAHETGCDLHVVHVSTRDGVWAAGNQLGDPYITVETCPHYLWFTQEDLIAVGAPLKCAPPLRDRETINALLVLSRVGMIAMIGSDHSPAPASMKSAEDTFQVWGGIAGVQSTLPVMLTVLRNCELVGRLTSYYAAHRFGLTTKGHIAVGIDADFALVDINAQYTLTRDMLLDRHKLSPYVGQTFRGLVKRTLVRGHTVFHDGKIVGNFRGRLITPNRKTKADA
jgi:allantoinase